MSNVKMVLFAEPSGSQLSVPPMSMFTEPSGVPRLINVTLSPAGATFAPVAVCVGARNWAEAVPANATTAAALSVFAIIIHLSSNKSEERRAPCTPHLPRPSLGWTRAPANKRAKQTHRPASTQRGWWQRIRH
jgi:hypothetical protein